jgi:hypothetical protein
VGTLFLGTAGTCPHPGLYILIKTLHIGGKYCHFKMMLPINNDMQNLSM